MCGAAPSHGNGRASDLSLELSRILMGRGIVDSLRDCQSWRQPGYENHNLIIYGKKKEFDVVVKVYIGGDSKCRENERAALDFFRRHNMPVPLTFESVSLVQDRVQYPILVIQELPGEPLAKILPLSSLEEIDLIAQEVIGLLKRQTDIEQFTSLKQECTKTMLESSWRRLDVRAGVEFRKTFWIPEDFIENRISDAETLGDPKKLYWVTHDWRLRHLLMDGCKISGLIDLEYARPNDFAAELANFFHDIVLHGGHNGRIFLRLIIKHLPQLTEANSTNFYLRVLQYMSKQAIAHILAKMSEGIDPLKLTREAALSLRYASITNILDLIDLEG